MDEKAKAIIKETTSTMRLVARLFPDDTEDVEEGVMFIGEDLVALRTTLENVADKLLDLYVDSETIYSQKK